MICFGNLLVFINFEDIFHNICVKKLILFNFEFYNFLVLFQKSKAEGLKNDKYDSAGWYQDFKPRLCHIRFGKWFWEIFSEISEPGIFIHFWPTLEILRSVNYSYIIFTSLVICYTFCNTIFSEINTYLAKKGVS